MAQGKAVDLRGRQFVVRLKEFFDQERRAGAVVSTQGSVSKVGGVPNELISDSDSSPKCKAIDE